MTKIGKTSEVASRPAASIQHCCGGRKEFSEVGKWTSDPIQAVDGKCTWVVRVGGHADGHDIVWESTLILTWIHNWEP